VKTYSTTGIKAISVPGDGTKVILEIATSEGDVAFGIPSAYVAAVLPMLVRANAEAKKKLGLSAHAAISFPVTRVTIGLPVGQEGVVLTVTFEGVEMSFDLDTESARRLSAALAEHVALSGAKPKTVQ
jgi:sialic acid synthase SpsE